MHEKLSKVVAALFVAAFAGFATADEPAPLELKGLRLGQATPNDVLAKFPGATQYADTLRALADSSKACPFPRSRISSASLNEHMECTKQFYEPYRIAGPGTAAANYSFHQVDGTIEAVTASFDKGSYSIVRDALKIKYGPPTRTSTVPKGNLQGATFESEQVVWTRPDGQILLSELSSDVKTSSLMISTSKFQQRTREQEKARAVEGASKL